MSRFTKVIPEFDDTPQWYEYTSYYSYDILYLDVTIDPPSVAANTSQEETVTINGIRAGDFPIVLQKPTHTAGIMIGNLRVSSDNTLSYQIINVTGGAINPPSETYRFAYIRNSQ